MGRSFLKRTLYNLTFASIENAKNRHFSKTEAKTEKSLLARYFDKSNELTGVEKDLIKAKWGSIIKSPLRDGYPLFRGMKAIYGFDESFLPTCYYFPQILNVLNPECIKPFLVHKSVAELLYSGIIKHPNTIIRTYGRSVLDSNYQSISRQGIINTLKRYAEGKSLLFKPAIDSNQGFGVRLVSGGELTSVIEEIVTGSIFNHCHDFVLQELVDQSEDTSLFNPTSLNCMRITTVCIDGDVFVGSRALKCGPTGACVDNIGTGKRGVIVGVEKDGTLAEFGFYGNGEIAYSHNGVNFKGHKIKAFSKVVESALLLHSRVPQCGIVGWDIALDKNNDPVLIEGNINYPGISLEQMCSGPIFGDRTNDVIDYLKLKMRKAKA